MSTETLQDLLNQRALLADEKARLYGENLRLRESLRLCAIEFEKYGAQHRAKIGDAEVKAAHNDHLVGCLRLILGDA